MKHKLLSILTVLALCLSLLPVTVFAESSGTADAPWPCGVNGNNVRAWLSGDGKTLTISGAGAMADYGLQSSRPWNGSKESILNVVIQNGVTSIGKSAFESFRKVTGIVIPDTVTSIGGYAFSGCFALSSINLPAGLTSIEWNTFAGCKALTSIKIPDGVLEIGDNAFNEAGLTEVKVPDGVASIGSWAFGNCASLTEVKIPTSVTNIGSGTFSNSEKAEIYYAGTLEDWNKITGAGECGVQADKLHTAAQPGAVARVGDAYHTTVQAAVEAASTIADGGTVTLLDDVTVTESVKLSEGTVTLDGQGKFTLTGTGSSTISVAGGALTLKDVTVENTNPGLELLPGEVMPGTAINVTGSGKLTVLDGSTVSATGKDGWGIYSSDGTVKIQGGTISGTAVGLRIERDRELTPGTDQLTGGSFSGNGNAVIYLNGLHDPSLGSLLGEGLALINNETGNAVDRTDVQTGSGTFTVEECRHKGAAGISNNNGTHRVECQYCGHTGTVEDCAYTFGGTTTGTCAACGDRVTVEVAGTENLTYTGSEMKPSVAVKRGETTLNVDTDYTVTYSDNINAGTAKVTVTIGTEQGSYTGTFHIGPAEPAIAWAADAAETLAYTGRVAELKTKPTVTLAGSGEYDGEEITYSYTKEGETATQNGLPMNAGTYYIKAAVPEQNNYAAAVTANTLTLTIKKVTTMVTAPVATRPAYNGTAQALVTAATTNAGPGAVQYALSKDGPWSTAIPTATDVGEYTVWYKVDETDNYTGVEAASVKAEIGKAQVTDISQSLMVRNGLEKTYTLDLGTFLPGLPEGQMYEELTYVLAETDIVDEAYIDSRTITLDGSVLTVPVKAVNKTGEDLVTIIKVTIKSENFQDIRLTISVTATNQTPLTITGVTAQGWTYDGKVHPGYTGTPRAEGYTGEFQVYYLGYLANGKNRKDAGTFQVEFVPVDSGYAGELSLTYTVEQAQVTVKADDQTAYVGDGMPELTYQVSGLAEGESLKTNPAPACDADMSKAGTYPITISGGAVPDGGNYKAEIVYQNGALTVAAKPAPPTTPGGNTGRPGGNSGGSSGSGSGANAPSQTSSLPVNTTGQNSAAQTTTTTAAPSASTVGGTASAAVDSAMGAEIVRQAVANNSQTVVIAPGVTGSVTRTEVSIPAGTVGQIGARTGASLTVSTPVAAVTVPNGGLGSLSAPGGTVVVSAEKTGNAVTLSVTAGGRTVERIPGGITLTVPAQTTPGTVAVLVRADGAREVVRRSVADGGRVTVPLEGSARLELVDNSKKFSDVPAGGWMADAVAFASARGLLNGNGAGRFNPELPMSRGMLAVVLHNLENNPEVPYTGVFPDVDGGKWYAGGVAWAAERGVVSGYSDGTFGPENGITREQLAVMLWRYAGSPAPVLEQLPFSDADRASGYALDALRWAVEGGILIGNGGQLHPQGTATRVQAAQMLKNFLEK